MTYAQKILALVPGGEMHRFGEQEVLLTWSVDDWSSEDVASVAGVEDENLVVVNRRLSLSMPPEIADAWAELTIGELLVRVVPKSHISKFRSNDDQWWFLIDGPLYRQLVDFISQAAELVHKMGRFIEPQCCEGIWSDVAASCLVWVHEDE